MTGEITLRGRVLPIGGLKEKLLAALRGGIKTVMIPEENAKDLTEISDSIKGGLEIIPVSRMDEVLKHALVRVPEPIQWDEAAKPVHDLGRRRGRGGRLRPHRALSGADTKQNGGLRAAVLLLGPPAGFRPARPRCPCR